MRMKNPLFGLVVMLGAVSGAHGQVRPSDPLQAATQCFHGGEFDYKNIDRLPATARFRTVDLQAGPAQVSTADGYRLMIYAKGTRPLVNLKIERSAEGKYAADRAVITAQMAELAGAVKPPFSMRVETSTQDGIDVMAINNPSIEHSPGVISFYTLLEPRSGTIATAYLLNQQRDLREFANDAEYVALRDRFISALTACMTRTLQ